jgi:hypothetical protein
MCMQIEILQEVRRAYSFLLFRGEKGLRKEAIIVFEYWDRMDGWIHTCPLLRPTARPLRDFFSAAIAIDGMASCRCWWCLSLGVEGRKSLVLRKVRDSGGDRLA